MRYGDNTAGTGGAGGATGSGYAVPLIEMPYGSYQEPLALVVSGGPGSGKSRLIGTAKGKIGVIPLERKTRGSVLRQAEEMGKVVVMPEIDLVRSSRAFLLATMPDSCVTADMFKGMRDEDATKKAEAEMGKKAENIPLDGEKPSCCQRCYYRWHANRTKSVALRMAAEEGIGTIAIDTFGQLVDDMLFANYGRNERIMPLDRKSFNREVCDFLNEISVKNLILTHHLTQIWKDNKPTSKSKPASSFSKIGHYATVMVRMERDDERTPRQVEEGMPLYTLTVEDCQANAGIIGMRLLTDDLITFGNLAQCVYPDSDEGYWE